jgi:hypothetical protein
MKLVVSPEGGTQIFTTLEQANFWLRKKWPVSDRERDLALGLMDAAMHCLISVAPARRAFLAAAKTAGFTLDDASAGMVADL